jgi:hypothetical protein
MYHQGSLLPDWESVPERSKDGLKKGKLKVSSRKAVKEDTTSIQLSLFDVVIPQTSESVHSSWFMGFSAMNHQPPTTIELLVTSLHDDSPISSVIRLLPGTYKGGFGVTIYRVTT